MKHRVILGIFGLCAAISAPALALTSLARVTPQNLTAQGFAFSARQRKDAEITVLVTRDTTRELSDRRFASLQIPSATEKSAERRVEGKRDGKKLSYRFRLSQEEFQQAHFRVQEGGGLLPGAIFEFRLADFVDSVRHK